MRAWLLVLIFWGTCAGLAGCQRLGADPQASAPEMPGAAQSATFVVTIDDLHSAHLGTRRRINVFLPGDYSANQDIRYPVLYANDGQYLPPVLIKEMLSRLYASGLMEKIILVAVEVDTSADRMSEYGVAGFPSAFGGGLQAQDYTDFMIGELLPYVNSHYRTLPGPADTGIMGWSLGGLSAFDIAWGHADVFGVVGVFSGSFWWSSQGSNLKMRLVHQIVGESEKRSGLRMWFMAGTAEERTDSDGDGVIDMVQNTLELMDELVQKGYQPGVDMAYFQLEGGQHLPAAWHKALPEFLAWAFPPAPVEY